jgi:hypothetical protein
LEELNRHVCRRRVRCSDTLVHLPAIDFLTQRNFEGKHILEFGGGQSTLWWSVHAESVLTVEADLNWYDRLRTQVGSNVRLHHIPVDLVTRTIEPIGRVLDANDVHAFDIIIIDGTLDGS